MCALAQSYSRLNDIQQTDTNPNTNPAMSCITGTVSNSLLSDNQGSVLQFADWPLGARVRFCLCFDWGGDGEGGMVFIERRRRDLFMETNKPPHHLSPSPPPHPTPTQPLTPPSLPPSPVCMYVL